MENQRSLTGEAAIIHITPCLFFFQQIDFSQYLEVLLDGLNATIDVDKDPILVTDPAYFKALAIVLAKAKPESIRECDPGLISRPNDQ